MRTLKPLRSFLGTNIFILLFSAVAFTQDATSDKNLEKGRIEIIRELKRQDFFKDATCKQVLDSLLQSVGLPEIGKTASIHGQRSNMDRSNQYAEPPILIDGIKSQRNSLQIRSLKADGLVHNWELEIDRTEEQSTPQASKGRRNPLKLETRLDFAYSSGNKVCDLVKLSFKSPSITQNFNPKKMSETTCLDLFSIKESSNEPAIHGFQTIMSWIKKDCAFALHYSKSVKALAK